MTDQHHGKLGIERGVGGVGVASICASLYGHTMGIEINLLTGTTCGLTTWLNGSTSALLHKKTTKQE